MFNSQSARENKGSICLPLFPLPLLLYYKQDNLKQATCERLLPFKTTFPSVLGTFYPAGPPLSKDVTSTVNPCMRACLVSQLCLTLCDLMKPARLLCPWDSPGKNGEWVSMPSSRGSSLPRDRTCISYVSCIAGRFFTH